MGLKDEMIDSLQKEIHLSPSYLLNEKGPEEIIETIYFGGGTPSLLTKEDIEVLLNAIKNNFTLSHEAEITLEANPDDINEEKLLFWKNAGINRLSIGIQSFKEFDLQWMNRAHNSRQAKASIYLAKNSGFTNISIDLIYGIPVLTDEEWEKNVNQVIELQIPHIACYALTVEPKTALQKMIEIKKKADVDTDQQARQFSLLMQWMKEAGYEQYEISNFAKPDCRSRHNSSYWQGKKYIGIGPSAHSYNGITRKWNVANNALYIQSLKNNAIPFEEEILTETQRLNEYIMTSLRTKEGLDLWQVEKNFSLQDRKGIELAAKNYLGKNLMVQNNEILLLTNAGKLFADGIAADLFSID